MENSRAAAGYRALYRSWRPRRFADLVGQEHVARTIRNAVAQGRPAHAYLFCGPRGTGKTSTARILAKALNCERPQDGEPCGDCPACLRVEAEEFLDIIEIDAASNRGIDEMRDLREKVRYAPSVGRCKVYIVDEVHMLTDPAWNAFLKTLEEPPERTVFALATTDPHRVPLTVLSRCQRFDFRRPTVEQIVGLLERVCRGEGLAVAPGVLDAIARRSEGGVRDALGLLDQGLAYAGPELSEADVALILGAAENEAVERLLSLVAAGEARGLLAEVERCYLSGKDFSRMARDLAQAARGRLILALADGAADADVWLRGAELLTGAEVGMRRTSQPRLLLEVILLRWLRDAQTGAAGDAVRAAARAPVAPAASPQIRPPSAAGGQASPEPTAVGPVPPAGAVPPVGPAPPVGSAAPAGPAPPAGPAQPAGAAQPVGPAQPAGAVPPVGPEPTAVGPVPHAGPAPGSGAADPGPPVAEPERPPAEDDAAAPPHAAAPAHAAVPPHVAAPPHAAVPPHVAAPPHAAGGGDPAPVASAAAPLTLEAVVSAWPRVVTALGRIERAAQAVFREARPVSLEAGKLTLALQPGYHLVAPSKRPAIEKALLSVLGACPAMQFVAGATQAAASGDPDARGGAAASPPPSPLREALDVFHGDEADPPGFEAGGGDAGIW